MTDLYNVYGTDQIENLKYQIQYLIDSTRVADKTFENGIDKFNVDTVIINRMPKEGDKTITIPLCEAIKIAESREEHLSLTHQNETWWIMKNVMRFHGDYIVGLYTAFGTNSFTIKDAIKKGITSDHRSRWFRDRNIFVKTGKGKWRLSSRIVEVVREVLNE